MGLMPKSHSMCESDTKKSDSMLCLEKNKKKQKQNLIQVNLNFRVNVDKVNRAHGGLAVNLEAKCIIYFAYQYSDSLFTNISK